MNFLLSVGCNNRLKAGKSMHAISNICMKQLNPGDLEMQRTHGFLKGTLPVGISLLVKLINIDRLHRFRCVNNETNIS